MGDEIPGKDTECHGQPSTELCSNVNLTIWLYIYNSDYSPHPQRDGIVESAPKMVQLPAFRIGQFPYFNLNLSPSSSRYFHFFFTSSLLTNSSQVKQTCIFFRKPDFIWFFHPIFPEVWKISWVSQGFLSIAPVEVMKDPILWKFTDLTHMLKKHVEKTIPNWKRPTYIYIYISSMKTKKTSTHIFQLNEVPG